MQFAKQLTTTLAFALAFAMCAHSALAAYRAQTAERGGSSGDTSGPAIGSPVEPSTVVEKQNPKVKRESKPGESGMAAGAPGIEGKPGTESGPAPKR